MGKNKGRRRKAVSDATPVSVTSPPPPSLPPPSAESSARGARSQSGATVGTLPPLASAPHILLPFPSHLPRPSTGFLRNEAPYRASFATALQTSYLGLAVDTDVLDDEATLHATLHALPLRTDVTQPFGLGTPCAKTYVTRCLVGDAGTTYKYLGLRLFAHVWPPSVATVAQTLTRRVATIHLPQLQRDRDTQWQNQHVNDAPVVRGRAQFDVCLINRMTARHAHLKADTVDPSLRTTVSWHADSSLEHYSTIAVYQTLVSSSAVTSATLPPPSNQWSVALRVAPNAEGPGSTSLKRSDGTESTGRDVPTAAPPIAISLPSNSAYYLLDDFNHHHQHAVLTTPQTASTRAAAVVPSDAQDDDWIRYSLTFRLLRESHNVEHMLQRCDRTCKTFHKRTTKLIRSQQLLLTEVETEWLRQFYIQGSQHATVQWASWHTSIHLLWQYWNRLEERTLGVIQWLHHAAHGQCLTDTRSTATAWSKAERKGRDKRRKAAAALQELLQREAKDPTGAASNDTDQMTLFDELARQLDARATMRELWTQRESDPSVRDVSHECRPLSFPAHFSTTRPASSDAPIPRDDYTSCRGSSPLPGLPSELRTLAHYVRALERAFQSGSDHDLPRCEFACLSDPSASLAGPLSGENDTETASPHAMAMDWTGWKNEDIQFGLEMQCPWAEALLDGSKSIETRSYTLPAGLVGRRLAILQSPKGTAGVSALGNTISLTKSNSTKVVGWCRFSTVKSYGSRREFVADETRHEVLASSGFGWNKDTTVLYGWVVQEYGTLDQGTEYTSGTRRFRSLYELHATDNGGPNQTQSSGTKKHARGKRQADGNGKPKKKRRF